MVDKKNSNKGLNDEEIFNDLGKHPFVGRLMKIMRSGDYAIHHDTDPVQAEDIYFRDLTSTEKAIMTLETRNIVSPAIGAALFWGGVKDREDYKEANAKMENGGMIVRQDWKIVFLPPLTEEEEHHMKIEQLVDVLSVHFL